MLKKIITMVVGVLVVASLAAGALAADKGACNGKVTKIEGDKVTVMMEGAVPAWVKVGGTVTAAGAAPKVLSVEGNEVVLRFSRAKAATIKVDSGISLSEFAGDELQGC